MIHEDLNIDDEVVILPSIVGSLGLHKEYQETLIGKTAYYRGRHSEGKSYLYFPHDNSKWWVENYTFEPVFTSTIELQDETMVLDLLGV